MRHTGRENELAYDSNNVFAKILRGELPSVKVYEDAQTLAFMDIMPSVEGHTLVIPKEAAETIFDLSGDAAVAVIQTTQKVAKAVKKALNAPGLMLVQLNGAAAGQSVPHLHFHILPREAGLDMKLHGRGMVDARQLEPIAARIRAAL
jgi:histidine triad (HIT) family protein